MEFLLITGILTVLAVVFRIHESGHIVSFIAHHMIALGAALLLSLWIHKQLYKN
jgi:hypothetical protein